MSAGEEAAKAGDLERIAAELRAADRFLLTTHEGPDGDALGSLLAMHELLGQLGKDSVMFLAEGEFPLPAEYDFLALDRVTSLPPSDVADRVLVFLDCGSRDRMPTEFLHREGAHVLNIDHHHDNTRFGAVNLVDPGASCTAEIVWRLARRLELEITPDVGTALYAGLVTDTGKFTYDNTGPEAHRMAAELIEAGVDAPEINRRIYERMPVERAKLLARALGKAERSSGGLALTYVAAEDYEATGATDRDTDGVVEALRALEGVVVAGVVRDKPKGQRAARKVSLRSSDGTVDVSAIAREKGGGGHKRAAGFTTDLSYPEVAEFVREQVGKQLG